MHKNVPAENASAPAVHPGADPDRPCPARKKPHPAGIMRAKPKLTRRVDRRVDPPRSMSEVIVKASAGLCTSVAMNTPRPALPRPARTLKSAATALASAMPPTSEWIIKPNAADPHGRARTAVSVASPGTGWESDCAALPARFVRGMLDCVIAVIHLGGICVRLVVVKREKSFQKKQCEQPERGPRNRRGRSNPDGLGQHVKKRGAQHRSGRKAEVHLQARVVQDGRQREQPPQDADDQNSQAERAERDRHVACLWSVRPHTLTNELIFDPTVAIDSCTGSAPDEIIKERSQGVRSEVERVIVLNPGGRFESTH